MPFCDIIIKSAICSAAEPANKSIISRGKTMGKKELTLPERKKRKNISTIVNASKHLFEQKGYYATSIESLCKYAMISKSTFFNYFGSKEQIIYLIVEEDVSDFSDFVDDLLNDTGPEPAAVIKEAFGYLVKGSINYKNITSVLYQFSVQDPRFKKLLSGYSETENRVIDYAKEKGVIRSDIPTDVIANMMHGCYIDAFSKSIDGDVQEFYYKALNSILELIKA